MHVHTIVNSAATAGKILTSDPNKTPIEVKSTTLVSASSLIWFCKLTSKVEFDYNGCPLENLIKLIETINCLESSTSTYFKES